MPDKPNLVFIFPDEFRQQAVGIMRQDPVFTPNLDRLGSQGLVLTQAVSNFPVCSPYRAMLFTGRYPFANGVYGNCYSDTIPLGIELRASDCCLSDVLHAAGYNLGYIGKWHLDLPKIEHAPYTEGWRGKPGEGTIWDAYTPPGPRRHGFDFWHSYGCCDRHLQPHYWEGDAPLEGRIDVYEWSVRHETDVAIDYLQNRGGRHRRGDKPFALFVAYNPPHMPFAQVPPQYLTHYADKPVEQLLNRPNVSGEGDGRWAFEHVRNYFAAVTGIDEQVGRILACLDQEGLSQDTIVVFTSDHGEMMGSHGMMYKVVWYDESLLVPFLIRWPGRIRPGTDDLLLSAPDVMPSLLGLMGLAGRVPTEVQGRDYSEILLGRQVARPFSAPYMWIKPENLSSGARGVRTHDYTYVVQRADGRESQILYDNRNDPYQMLNVAAQRPEVVQRLQVELANWLERTEDPWVRPP
jgi:arylsulfatase A-like enzyme